MSKRPRSKKTSNIEFRVSPELKDALGRFSAARGETVSETIRALVNRELQATVNGIHPGETMMARLTKSNLARGTAMMATVAALAVGYSFAAQTPATASVGVEVRMAFAEFDSNGDKVITEDEYIEVIAQEREDEAGYEGEIAGLLEACAGTFIAEEIAEEQAELAMPIDAVAKERVAYLDSDQDGAVTFDELEAYVLAERARDFLEFDADGNGFVTLEEVAALLAPTDVEAERAELSAEGLSEACVTALVADDEVEETDESPRVVMAEFDLDRDGRVSLHEYLDH